MKAPSLLVALLLASPLPAFAAAAVESPVKPVELNVVPVGAVDVRIPVQGTPTLSPIFRQEIASLAPMLLATAPQIPLQGISVADQVVLLPKETKDIRPGARVAFISSPHSSPKIRSLTPETAEKLQGIVASGDYLAANDLLASLFDGAASRRAVAAAPSADSSGLDAWIASFKPNALRRMLANVSPEGAAKGSVAASPSRENPDYWYNWKRDAALTMSDVAGLAERASSDREKRKYLQILADYAVFARNIQKITTLTGEGEPKVNMDGTAFNGPWGRPQNDGPAEEASALMAFIDLLRKPVSFALKYYGDFTLGIKKSLEYVSHQWTNTSYDVWEEVKGLHFDTLMAQRTALVMGAELADRVKDPGAATWYRKQAELIEKEISGPSGFWDPQRGYLVSTLDRDAGIDYKSSGLDSAVIISVLRRRLPNDTFFAASDEKVLATALALKQKFKQLYPINQRADAPGVAIGRYPEDQYFGGNPWVIATAAFAQLQYTVANEFRDRGFIALTPINLPFFRDALNNDADALALRAGTSLGAGDPMFNKIIHALKDRGDEYLATIKYHANPDGSLSEQMDKNSGYMTSATNLTWNYAAFLAAAQARDAPLAKPN